VSLSPTGEPDAHQTHLPETNATYDSVRGLKPPTVLGTTSHLLIYSYPSGRDAVVLLLRDCIQRHAPGHSFSFHFVEIEKKGSFTHSLFLTCSFLSPFEV